MTTNMKINWIRACVIAAFVVALIISIHSHRARGAEPSIQPYGMISWTGIDGEAELGAGVEAMWSITKNLHVSGFGEADNVHGTLIERFGAGLKYTAFLGKHLGLDGGLSPAYDLEQDRFFARVPLGADLYAIRSKNVDFSLRLQYAFDITGGGPNGASTGRAFFGPRFGFKF